MNISRPAWALFLAALGLTSARGAGADLPWTTYEAETMHTTGSVLGPKYQPYCVETESSGERCVRLSAGEFVGFSAAADANALVVRYSVPDADQGGGLSAELTLQVDGAVVRTLPLTSRYSHLYGKYPFTNDPRAGAHRNFYDEVRVSGLKIAKGSVVRLEKTATGAPTCVVDLVDLESVRPPRPAPVNALSLVDFGGIGDGRADATEALRTCIAAAAKARRPVWVPPGRYVLTGDINVPSGVTIAGAGMWYSTFVGDPALYNRPDRRVRFRLAGDHIVLADFAIIGRLDYRNDNEPNDGLVCQGCSNSVIARIWVEHTKVGLWAYNGDHLRVEGCRFRDTIADGVNLCVGTIATVIENCTARGTGDDCFAIWPSPSDQGFAEAHRPGGNVIRDCTGQLPFLANGGALYGGAGNRIEDCRFTDITAGCGILISSTFPTSDPALKIDNNFSGTTVVRGCELLRCGGYDHDWAWRGALQICLDRRSISGLAISDVTIADSLSDGFSVVAPGAAKGEGTLTNTRLENVTVTKVGLGTTSPSGGLWIRDDASGALVAENCHFSTVHNDSKSFKIETR
ncbi:MAG TPA: glycosyl hydrolase family 28-related protein [Opitutaceae bacterium]|nr:glycosyl hydrolase family 28-related protein [Opitutaceae bacterium]